MNEIHSDLKMRSNSITASSIPNRRAKVHQDDATIEEENVVDKIIFNYRKRGLKDVQHRVNDDTKQLTSFTIKNVY